MIDSSVKLDEKINLHKISLTPLTTSFIETDYFEDDKCYGYRCENCGFSFTSYYIKVHKYCYNCGAINKDSEFYRKVTMAKEYIKEAEEALKNEQG